MRKFFKYSAISLGMLSLMGVSIAYATSYQVFSDISFSNPAALNSVKKEEFILGGLTLFSRFHFAGTAAGVNGTASSNTTDELPYARAAVRLAPQWVASLDITQPYFTDIRYPRNSIVNFFATETFLRDTNISPKLSYQATEKLAVGVGFDANNFYNGQLNFVVPPLGLLTNKADSWGFGWDVGLFYAATKATYLSLSYYSQIVQHLDGVSTWGLFTNKNLCADVKLPATTILNVIQMLSPTWALSGTVRYVQWNVVRYLVLQHTAVGGTITVPEFFYNNASYELATHYQINDKWAVLGAVDYEPNIQPTWTRNVGLPTYNRVIPAIGAEYALSKELKAKLVYGHVYSKAPINMSIATGPHIQGTEHVNIDAIDFSITYDI